VQYHN
jgi:hypothetical protein